MNESLTLELTRLKEQLAAETEARLKLDGELKALKRRHDSILDSVNEIVFQTDLTGNWTFLNSAWSDFLEHPVHASLGRPFTEHMHRNDQVRVLALLDAVVGGDTEMARAEIRFNTASGRERWFELLVRLTLDIDGPVKGITGTLTDISARKKAEAELIEVHRVMVDASREAGMAEVATGVLHNVGNVLNSVNVSASMVQDRLRESKLARLVDAAKLLKEHEGDIGGFLASDPKGKLLPGFLIKLATHLTVEQEEAVKELESLSRNIEHIKEIVAMQQNYAKVSGVSEILSPVQVVEDVLRMNEEGFVRHGITVERRFEEVPAITMDKHKVMQIVVNLVRNAKHAVSACEREDKKITVSVRSNGGQRLVIEVADNGVGIPPENATKIFGHGFTTKKDGHGFGLHSGALTAREIGGSLSVSSEGHGHGARFVLEIPMAPTSTNTKAA